MSSEKISVAVCMGSDSDWPVMRAATEILTELGVSNAAMVLSAHRMPLEMSAFAQSARDNGFDVIIAGAGGAAHLPGMIAALTTLPVIGVPVSATKLDGMDSLLSIVQMPAGIQSQLLRLTTRKMPGFWLLESWVSATRYSPKNLKATHMNSTPKLPRSKKT